MEKVTMEFTPQHHSVMILHWNIHFATLLRAVIYFLSLEGTTQDQSVAIHSPTQQEEIYRRELWDQADGDWFNFLHVAFKCTQSVDGPGGWGGAALGAPIGGRSLTTMQRWALQKPVVPSGLSASEDDDWSSQTHRSSFSAWMQIWSPDDEDTCVKFVDVVETRCRRAHFRFKHVQASPAPVSLNLHRPPLHSSRCPLMVYFLPASYTSVQLLLDNNHQAEQCM